MKHLVGCYFIFILYSCTGNSSPQTEKGLTQPSLPKEDKNLNASFVLRNVKNLNFIDSLYWDFENLYLDASQKQKFEKLTKGQKILLLSSLLKDHNSKGIDTNWIKEDLQAFVVAKQSSIGHLQPTLIKVFGTDYSAVLLINLENGNKPISGFPIYAIENSGPEISEDTIIVTRPKIKCRFSRNTILLFKLTGICYPKSVDPTLFTIDSITSEISIHRNGMLKTRKLDSSRYQRKSELHYFQSY